MYNDRTQATQRKYGCLKLQSSPYGIKLDCEYDSVLNSTIQRNPKVLSSIKVATHCVSKKGESFNSSRSSVGVAITVAGSWQVSVVESAIDGRMYRTCSGCCCCWHARFHQQNGIICTAVQFISQHIHQNDDQSRVEAAKVTHAAWLTLWSLIMHNYATHFMSASDSRLSI
jgi:hypothetical protein